MHCERNRRPRGIRKSGKSGNQWNVVNYQNLSRKPILETGARLFVVVVIVVDVDVDVVVVVVVAVFFVAPFVVDCREL